MIPMKVIYHIAPLFIFFFPVSLFAAPFQAEGFKTGEMTDHSAIVWTRLTRNEKANPADRPLFEILYTKKGKGRRFPVTGVKYASKGGAADLPFAVPGMEGETRVRFRPLAGGEWRETPWTPVAKEWDFTCQHILNDLSPGTRYEIEVESRGTDGKEAGAVQKGGFVTSPSPEVSASVSFTVSTGQMFSDRNSDDGYAIYDSMLKDPPDFFVHTGDIVYYDREAKSPDLANWLWQRMYSRPSNVRFHKRVGSYFMKDDHDTFRDDCWPSIKTQSMGSNLCQRAGHLCASGADAWAENLSNTTMGKRFTDLDGRRPGFPQPEYHDRWARQNNMGSGAEEVVPKNIFRK